MSLTITYNDDVLFNSIKFTQTDTELYYKYVHTQSLFLSKDVPYEITYRLYAEPSGAVAGESTFTPFDIYITGSDNNTRAFDRNDSLGYFVDISTASAYTYEEKSHIIIPQYDGTGSLCLALKYGTYYISNIEVKPFTDSNNSVAEMRFSIPTPETKRNESIAIYPTYIGSNNKPIGEVGDTLVNTGQGGGFSIYTTVTGSNLVISHGDNLIEGSLFVGSNLRTGVEISGESNAMIRSVGYEGFVSAAAFPEHSGFLLYSGSVLSGSGDYYRGVGLELHAGNGSGSLRYRVDDSGSFLEVSGNIYAENGYFSGIISASEGHIGGWIINSSSLYSEISDTGGIRMDSSIPAFSFYSGSIEFLTMKTDTKQITVYITETGSGDALFTSRVLVTGSVSITTAYMIMGNSGVPDTGSSFIIDFASGMEALPGAFIITGSSNVSYDLISGSTYTITSPLYLDGRLEDNQGQLISQWKRANPPFEPFVYGGVITQSQFTTNNSFGISSTNGALWDGANVNYGTTAVYAGNGNTYGTIVGNPIANLPRWQDTGQGGWQLYDTIHAGIMSYQYRGIGQGIQASVYALKNGAGTSNTHIYDAHTAILADAAPGTNAKSGVFRYGRFIVGDPWHYYASASFTASDYDIPFYVDAQQNKNNTPNTSFGRVGINTYTPSYELHVVGAIYATGDITAFSDERKKMNIQHITGSLDIIKKLRGVRYNWKKGKEGPMPNKRFIRDEDKIRIGLIAQQVEPILPEVVFTDDDGYKSINYANIVSVLIEGMKEQQQEIGELRERIDKIDANNKEK